MIGKPGSQHVGPMQNWAKRPHLSSHAGLPQQIQVGFGNLNSKPSSFVSANSFQDLLVKMSEPLRLKSLESAPKKPAHVTCEMVQKTSKKNAGANELLFDG